MTFEPEKLATFLEIFEQSKNKIRAMNQYRDSELFKTTWAKTKVLFAAKPLAFSTHVISQTH